MLCWPWLEWDVISTPPRIDMTLIAGFKCVDGYVLCADSQETVKEKGNEYRVMRKKIAPIKHVDFELSIAAAGEGPTINPFISKIRKASRKITAGDLDEVSDWLRQELKVYFREQRIRPRTANSRIRLTIGAWHKSGRSALWDAEGGEVSEVEEYSLIGWADYKYEYLVQQLYQPSLSIAQGIFLGLYVMSLAERTSNYVKGPISVVVIKDNGIHPQKPELIRELDNRVQLFAAHFDKLLLACPDTGLAHGEFAARVKEFVESVAHLRKEYVEESVGQAIEEGLNKINDAYNLIPAGTMVEIVQPTQVQTAALQKMHEEIATALRQTDAAVQELPQVIANLEVLKEYQKRVIEHIREKKDLPGKEENEAAHRALEGITKASLMGPYKVSQDIWSMICRVNEVMPLQIGLGERENPRMRFATMAVRWAVIEQALAYIEAKQSASQTLADQP
jgi:hypothetical protein